MILGPTPWLPGAAGRWLAEPIPAARLYALRVGVGVLVLLDVLFLYLADYRALYGPHGYTQPEVMAPHFPSDRLTWSLLRFLPMGNAWLFLFVVWAISCVFMITTNARLWPMIAWVCSASVLFANPFMHSGGDRLRSILLFTLMLSPLPSRGDVRASHVVSGWPAKVILFQLCMMYFFAGAYKLLHPGWQSGVAMYYILNNGTWCLAPRLFSSDHPWMFTFCKLVSWGTILWEMLFPLLVLIPWTRWRLGLGLGVLFHLLCVVFLQTSTFPLYSLACYLPFVPWERLQRRPDGIDQ